MMNKYNPYTVPENFFETVCSEAISRHRRHRRALILGTAALIAAACLICIPISVRYQGTRSENAGTKVNNLAEMYEYDIFLQINFTE